MNLHNITRESFGDMKDGIAWVAFYKIGRSWESGTIYSDDTDKNGEPILNESEQQFLTCILALDPNAVFLNGYHTNVGPYDDMTLATLEDGIRWNYEGNRNTLQRFLQRHGINIDAEQKKHPA